MAKKAAKKSSPLPKVAMVLLSLAGIVVLKQVFLLLVVGMLPAIGSYFMDRENGRPLFKTVLAFNFAGVFYFVISLMSTTPIDTSAVKAALRDMNTYLTIYSSAAIAYMVYYLAPFITFGALSVFTHGNLIRLRGAQQRLLADWGPDLQEIDEVFNKELVDKRQQDALKGQS
jgi:hypothetical protein